MRLLSRFLRPVIAAGCLAVFARVHAAVSIVSSGSPSASTYVLGGASHGQTFDSLPTTGSTWANDFIIPGWSAISGVGTLNSVAVNAIDGTSNPPNLVLSNVGTAGSSDRAFAFHTQVAATPTHLGLAFVNNSGRDLTAFSLAFAAEQWRESTNQRTVTVTVQYRVGATFADLHATTGWTELPTLTANTLNGTAPSSTARSITDVPVSVPAGSSFWLRWTFSNSATTATSSHDLLAIDNIVFSATAPAAGTAPVITTHPLSRTVAVGEPVTLVSAATGTPAPTFQWFTGVAPELVPVPGATSATLELGPVNAGHAGSYTVVATNSLGSDTSDPAVLTVTTDPIPPQILVPPSNVTANEGQPATFTVEASGTPPLAYQWFWSDGGDFFPISGATSATYVIEAVNPHMPGAYRVTVTNTSSSVTSAPATLTVVSPPVITKQPGSITANLGDNVGVSVEVSGTAPFTYQWFHDDEPVPDSNRLSLSFLPVTAADAGDYKVTITNPAGSVTSAVATLTVILPPEPPVILASPLSRGGVFGGDVILAVTASGTPPLSYAWYKNDVLLPATTGPSISLVGLSASDAGDYRVTVTNALDSAFSAVATLTVSAAPAPASFSLRGFGEATTGGGVLADTATGYRKVYNAADFRSALTSSATRVIEIMNDLDLGWNEIPAAERTGRFRSNTAALLHPVLLASGVTQIDIQDTTNLTIFSAHGATIRHAEFNVKRCTNLIIRNLRFAELWEWDESSKGDYDRNDWDYITVDIDSTNVWIDHCDFAKAYDGVVDIKGGSNRVTLSWCRVLEDDGGPASFVRRQIEALETTRASHPMYDFLRTNGFSIDDIVAITRSQKKGHLVGANEFDADNALLSVTLHHNLYVGMQDRLPRLRGGNAHSYNLQVDNRHAYAASQLYAARVAAMSSTNATKLSNGTYKFGVIQNGAISTEGGSVLLEKSVFEGVRYALRNNQADVSDSSYTGRIRAEDVIFKFGATNFRGGSDTPAHPLGPTQAPELLPFAWNGFATLPYAYTPDDPAALPLILSVGTGAGVLTWEKINWLRTAYPAGDAFPFISQHPQPVAAVSGANASFTVAASATPAPTYQWLRDGSPLLGATSASHTITGTGPGDLGGYSVRVTNTYGTATSLRAALTLTTPPAPTFATWASDRGLSGSAAEPAADTDGDGVALLLEYALGLDPAIADAAVAGRLPVLAPAGGGGLVFRYTRPKSVTGLSYTVQLSTDLLGWSPSGVPPTLESSTATTETYVVPLPAAARSFARLRVESSP